MFVLTCVLEDLEITQRKESRKLLPELQMVTVIPWTFHSMALVLQMGSMGAAGVAAPLARKYRCTTEDCRMQMLFFLWHHSWALWHTSFFYFFSPKMLHAFSGRILWMPPHSECREGNIGLDLSTPELAIWKSTRALELTAVFPGDSLWPLLTREKWYCPPGFMIYIPVCWNQHAKLQRNLFHQIQLPILSASSWMAFKGLWEAGKGCLVFHGGILPFLAFLCFNFFLLKWQESLHVVVSSSYIYFHLRSARYWANLHFSSGLQKQ